MNISTETREILRNYKAVINARRRENHRVNATMFDRYLPFSCPLKYFRY
ncbi:hypothetical protein MZD99_23145 [Escherichia coli]|nr:hypothetical protein [Escherichia coli]